MFRIAMLATAVALAACGGGGGGAAPAPVANVSAEGIWSGTGSNGVLVSFVILENGETWGFYGTSASINGALFGNTTTNGSSVSVSGSSFDFISRTSSPGSVTGSVVGKATLNVVSNAGTTVNAAYSATYDQAPSLAALAGTYFGQAVTGSIAPQNTSVTISGTGAVSSIAPGCTTSGAVVPRPTGKNIFNISLTSVGLSCALGNGTVVTGVASFNPATRQIIAMALNSAKSDGLVFSGIR